MDIVVKWFTKKIRSLFHLKDKNPHSAWKTYEGTCPCLGKYIDETKRNVEERWNEHQKPNKNSEPAKHLRDFPDHKLNWKRLPTGPTNSKLHKILESSMIVLKRRILNEQLHFDQLILFRNGVT